MCCPAPGFVASALVLACSLASPAVGTGAEAAGFDVYVGTYTGGGSEGIYRFRFDPDTGTMGPATLAARTSNPSFLTLDPSKTHLYAVNEVDTFEGKPGGAVSAFALDPKSGNLTPLNHQSTVGGGPCHLVVDASGKNVLAANYGGGSVVVLPLVAGGRLGPASAFVQHKGTGADPARQSGPHAHSVNLDAANAFAFVADLGLDRVLVYKFDPAKGTLTPNAPPSAATAPASGPRHFAFHPSGKFAYAIGELDSTVTAWVYDPERGRLLPLQTVSTLPSGVTATNYPADIRVHPSGRFLYGSNRGHDSIACYTIDRTTGRLTFVGTQGEGIKNPRNFAIEPAGRFLLVANQDLDTVVAFAIDKANGSLTPTGQVTKVPKPVCLQFLERGE